MNNFEYYNPVRLIFGAGEIKRAASEVKELGKKVMLVSYSNISFLQTTIDNLISDLKNEDVEVVTFFEFEENPDITTVTKGSDICKSEAVEAVIAIGGGSVMDGAKAVAAGACYEGDLWNMVYSRHDDVKAVPPEKALPTMMIPTLPATGSEMNQCAVVSNRELKEKSYIWSQCIYPKVSIVDPELTVGLPPYNTACAAADTISHVLEIYLNGEEDTDLQHYFQEGVMKTVIDNIGKVLENPKDISARAHLQWAATCAINGWSSPGDAWTPIHQVGHVLTSLHGVAHGASLAVLMPAWMKKMSVTKPNQYFRFATRVMDVMAEGKSNEDVISEGIEKFKQFLKGIGVSVSLKEMNIEKENFASITDGVEKVSFSADGTLACNPPVTKQDIHEILELAI